MASTDAIFLSLVSNMVLSAPSARRAASVETTVCFVMNAVAPRTAAATSAAGAWVARASTDASALPFYLLGQSASDWSHATFTLDGFLGTYRGKIEVQFESPKLMKQSAAKDMIVDADGKVIASFEADKWLFNNARGVRMNFGFTIVETSLNRAEFRWKRRECLASGIAFAQIDLLLQGEPVLEDEALEILRLVYEIARVAFVREVDVWLNFPFFGL